LNLIQTNGTKHHELTIKDGDQILNQKIYEKADIIFQAMGIDPKNVKLASLINNIQLLKNFETFRELTIARHNIDPNVWKKDTLDQLDPKVRYYLNHLTNYSNLFPWNRHFPVFFFYLFFFPFHLTHLFFIFFTS